MWTSICIIQEVTREGAIILGQKTVVSGKKLVGIQMSFSDYLKLFFLHVHEHVRHDLGPSSKKLNTN